MVVDTYRGAILSGARRAASVVLPPRALLAAVAWSKWYLGEKEMRLLPWVCARDRAGIDVGANAGVYSWHMQRLCAEVHAFEPIPELANALRSALPRCLIHDYALSDEDRDASLKIPVFHGEQFAALASLDYSFEEAEGTRTIEVKLRRLDDEGISNIGFIKIDAEGHERRVLQGARDVLEQQKPTLQIEIQDRTSPGGIAETVAILNDLGYDAWYMHRGRLLPFAAFDVGLLQNPSNVSADGWVTDTYIDNFLFFPKSPQWPEQRRAIAKFSQPA